MKISIVYHSVTGNTKKQADLIRDGALKIDGVEIKSMSIDDVDRNWINDSKAVIFGCPTYEGSCSWQMKKFLDSIDVDLGGKIGGTFASQNWPGGGGADFAEMTIIAALLVHGMLIYSGGVAEGYPPIHFGAVSQKFPSSEIDIARARKLGENIAKMAIKLFG